MNWTLFLSFLLTSIIVLAMPGPSFVYAVAVGARASAREISVNALGMGLGGAVITTLLAFGASALLAASPVAFNTLQVIGCVYLIYLGLATFLASPIEAQTDAALKNRSSMSELLKGFSVELGNPKAVLFYASFVPQFVDHGLGNARFQLLVLGGTFIALQVVWDTTLMFAVRRLRVGLEGFTSTRAQGFASRVSGAVIMLLGVALLLQGRLRALK